MSTSCSVCGGFSCVCPPSAGWTPPTYTGRGFVVDSDGTLNVDRTFAACVEDTNGDRFTMIYDPATDSAEYEPLDTTALTPVGTLISCAGFHNFGCVDDGVQQWLIMPSADGLSTVFVDPTTGVAGTPGASYAPCGGYPLASDTSAGIVELATGAEVAAGTDSTRAVTPDSAKSIGAGNFVDIQRFNQSGLGLTHTTLMGAYAQAGVTQTWNRPTGWNTYDLHVLSGQAEVNITLADQFYVGVRINSDTTSYGLNDNWRGSSSSQTIGLIHTPVLGESAATYNFDMEYRLLAIAGTSPTFTFSSYDFLVLAIRQS